MFEKAQQYMSANAKAAAALEFVQDFLIKLQLGIKPLMHFTNTFSLNNVIARLSKIMNRADKNCAHF